MIQEHPSVLLLACENCLELARILATICTYVMEENNNGLVDFDLK